MSKYKPQHNRLLFIDSKIGEGNYPNCGSLAEEWEVSRKTMQRDIEYMRYQLQAPLEYSARHRGYYYTETNFKLPAISIKESDLFAIALAEEMLLQYKGTPYYDNLSSIFKKIQDALPDREVMKSRDAKIRFTVFPPPGTTIQHTIWDTVFSGLRQSKRLMIEYQTPGQAATIRKLDPYHATRYDGEWYVIGYCHLRRKIRTFCLSRIQKAVDINEIFTLPADFDFHHITSSRFGVHWGESTVHVRVWFAQRVATYIHERRWHPTQVITHNEDGSIVLALTVNHTFELKKWVLSWGKDARVLEPDQLAADLQEEIEGMRAIYTS